MMKNIRVLVVDDNAEVRADLQMILGLIDGLVVIGDASNAGDAFNTASLTKPDLMIIDLEMGGPIGTEMDGCKVIRQVKSLRPAPVVFVLTVHGYDTAREEAFRAGADAFFEKGIEIKDLLNAVKNLLTRSR